MMNSGLAGGVADVILRRRPSLGIDQRTLAALCCRQDRLRGTVQRPPRGDGRLTVLLASGAPPLRFRVSVRARPRTRSVSPPASRKRTITLHPRSLPPPITRTERSVRGASADRHGQEIRSTRLFCGLLVVTPRLKLIDNRCCIRFIYVIVDPLNHEEPWLDPFVPCVERWRC